MNNVTVIGTATGTGGIMVDTTNGGGAEIRSCIIAGYTNGYGVKGNSNVHTAYTDFWQLKTKYSGAVSEAEGVLMVDPLFADTTFRLSPASPVLAAGERESPMGAWFLSGRNDRENFTSGITPVSGVTPALTKSLNSVAKQPAEFLSSGVALNLKYTPETGDVEKMLDNFAASVEGYVDYGDGNGTGGMEIQFNVTTHDTFVDAVKHPEKYPELLVRVSGYTAYFKDLNPQMQKEIIDRTEYLLSKGSHVHYEPFYL